MNNAHKEQAEALLQAGQRDLLALQLLNGTGRAPHEVVGFHAQQACEKLMKSMLVLHGVTFDRTHDLIVLHELLEQKHIPIPADKEKLRALNSYAIQFPLLRNKLLGSGKIMQLQVPGSVRTRTLWHGA